MTRLDRPGNEQYAGGVIQRASISFLVPTGSSTADAAEIAQLVIADQLHPEFTNRLPVLESVSPTGESMVSGSSRAWVVVATWARSSAQFNPPPNDTDLDYSRFTFASDMTEIEIPRVRLSISFVDKVDGSQQTVEEWINEPVKLLVPRFRLQLRVNVDASLIESAMAAIANETGKTHAVAGADFLFSGGTAGEDVEDTISVDYEWERIAGNQEFLWPGDSSMITPARLANQVYSISTPSNGSGLPTIEAIDAYAAGSLAALPGVVSP